MKKNILKIYLELLPKPTKQILQDLVKISPDGILAGGTAVMLFLAHRKSFDLDVFLPTVIKKQLLLKLKLFYGNQLKQVIVDTSFELSVLIRPNIKLSFVFFSFKPLHKLVATDSILLFALPDLASNKAYVIGRRGAWRDYVDLFFLIKSGISFDKLIKDAKKRFGSAFSEKLFLEQLTYFGDISDFTIEYIGKEYKPKEIKKYFETLVKDYLERYRT